MLLSILPSKGNQIWGGNWGATGVVCLLQLSRYVFLFFFSVVRKMETAFKVVKVGRIRAWWLCNYFSGSALMGGGGTRPRVQGQINETVEKITCDYGASARRSLKLSSFCREVAAAP